MISEALAAGPGSGRAHGLPLPSLPLRLLGCPLGAAAAFRIPGGAALSAPIGPRPEAAPPAAPALEGASAARSQALAGLAWEELGVTVDHLLAVPWKELGAKEAVDRLLALAGREVGADGV
jgi:hypothetical protein